MADSPQTSDLSEPPSDSDVEDQFSTAVPSPRPSADISHADAEHLAPPPSKRRKTGPSSLSTFDRALSSQPAEDQDDDIALSSDGWSSAPGSPSHSEYTLREDAQTSCLWRDCDFGSAINNDELVKHVQGTHCATGGPKKSKYVCEWGECQRKTSNHPSGYALKAHMRSHTKEKPYYCALPECDKAFTRSDALAKHMRTVHEPEQPRGASTTNDPTPPGKGKGNVRLKLANGSSTSSAGKPPPTPTTADLLAPTHDEDGNEVIPSPANDNITYIPAHHPITGQPGFMIHYPPDIQFTAWESAIAANDLMRVLRRQLHWAQKEQDELKKEVEELEHIKREEWNLKEILLEGVMEAELAWADQDGLLRNVEERVIEAMERDVEPSAHNPWTGGHKPARPSFLRQPRDHDTAMVDVANTPNEMARDQGQQQQEDTPSPPPTGKSGGFDGDNDPYDNYLAGRMAEYEEMERQRSFQNTPQKAPASLGEKETAERRREREREVTEAETDAVGALMGMSGGGTKA